MKITKKLSVLQVQLSHEHSRVFPVAKPQLKNWGWIEHRRMETIFFPEWFDLNRFGSVRGFAVQLKCWIENLNYYSLVEEKTAKIRKESWKRKQSVLSWTTIRGVARGVCVCVWCVCYIVTNFQKYSIIFTILMTEELNFPRNQGFLTPKAAQILKIFSVRFARHVSV